MLVYSRVSCQLQPNPFVALGYAIRDVGLESSLMKTTMNVTYPKRS